VLLAIETVALLIFHAALARRLQEGAAELASALAAMQSARSTSAALASVLSERVAAAVGALEGSLTGPVPDLRRQVGALTELLAESRRSLPRELVAAPSSLERRLEDLRRMAVSWGGGVVLLGLAALVPALWWLELREFIGPSLAMAALAGGVALARARAPSRERALLWILLAGIAAIDARNAWRLRGLAPGIPPNLISFDLFALLGTAAVGISLGVAELAVLLAVMLASIAVHGNLSWTVPVVNASTYLLACWVIWQMPRQLLRLLEERSAEAALELRHRRRLVATLFHDLANVLLASQGILDDTAGERLAPADLEDLRGLIARMRGITASASGPGPLAMVSVGSLWSEMERLLEVRLRRKGLALRVSGPGNLQVRCDEPLLKESVLGNLLTNAVKFSPPGALIDLSTRAEGSWVALEVADRGPGLPADVRETLGRAPVSSRLGTAGEPGSGYGLLLAVEHVRSMGGSLALEPREGGGLRATVRLPLHSGGETVAGTSVE